LKPLRSFSGAASMPRHMPHAGLRHYRHTLATSYTPPHATCRDVITPLSPMPVTLHCHDVRSQPLIAPDKPYAACQTATSPHGARQAITATPHARRYDKPHGHIQAIISQMPPHCHMLHCHIGFRCAFTRPYAKVTRHTRHYAPHATLPHAIRSHAFMLPIRH
jgi:hypothetical protein